MDRESLRFIVSRLERVVELRPKYALFSLETQSLKGHLNIYTTFSMKGPKVLGTILENSSTKSYLKPRLLSGNSKAS